MKTSAVISECGAYRYVLRREWDALLPTLVFVMLNPSTADATQNDATIRKCVGFARRNGFGSISVVNLFALRSRNPAALRSHPEPIGPDNDAWILRETRDPMRSVVVAWGCNARHFPGRVVAVRDMLGRATRALRITKDGHPEHPVMLPYDLMPVPWPPSATPTKEGG